MLTTSAQAARKITTMNLPSFSSFFRPAPLVKVLGAGVGTLAVLSLGSLPGQAMGIVLDFEGVGNEVPIASYYPSTTFANNALALEAFSAYYSSIGASGQLSFFDGPDGTGSLIASRSLAPLGSNCPGGSDPGAAFSCWAQVSVALPSSATSVRFDAPANEMIFDNVGFNNVPVPGPLPVVGAAAAFGVSRRLRQRVRAASSNAQIG